MKQIDVNDGAVENALKWISEGKNHSLRDDQLTELVRFLLKKVNDLEEAINNISKKD